MATALNQANIDVLNGYGPQPTPEKGTQPISAYGLRPLFAFFFLLFAFLRFQNASGHRCAPCRMRNTSTRSRMR
jgi:hypothetical protein